MYFDVRTVHLVQFIVQTNNAQHMFIYIYIYIYKQYFIHRKYSYMFRYICIIFRESYLSTLLKLQGLIKVTNSIKSED